MVADKHAGKYTKLHLFFEPLQSYFNSSLIFLTETWLTALIAATQCSKTMAGMSKLQAIKGSQDRLMENLWIFRLALCYITAAPSAKCYITM